MMLSALCVLLTTAPPAQTANGEADAGREALQLLINPDLTLPLDSDGLPLGWFKAAAPWMTEKLEMTLERETVNGVDVPYLRLHQEKPAPNLYNNWAQELAYAPEGATFRLECELATEGAAEPGARPVINCFDRNDTLLAAIQSGSAAGLAGTTPWQPFVLEGTFPAGCRKAILRFGLATGCEGTLKIRNPRLYLIDVPPAASQPPGDPEEGLELLSNGAFEEDARGGDPTGWLRAMIPAMAIDHHAGLEEIAGRGKVAYIEQAGTHRPLVNNWAQRADIVLPRTTLELSVDVKTRDVPENTGIVMIQCWDGDDDDSRLLAAATSRTADPIGGTTDWRTVRMELPVPEGTEAIIVRCGLSQSGRIWFDNASLKVVAPPARAESGDGAEPTPETVDKLARVREVADNLVRVAQVEIGRDGRVRREIVARPDGRFDVILSLEF
jgi:hypothetical protein